jgi:two-component system, chemotaxis family, protein-glutamate methylesterase/glutaminase
MGSYDIVVIGASLGGLRALMTLLEGLSASFPLPIAIAQHRHREAADGLAAFLQHHSALQICEAEDKQPLAAGNVYLAPADYHLMVERGGLALSTEAPVLLARPSIDVLFETAADAYGAGVVGVILTGASDDGARGLALVKARGGLTVVQDPGSAESSVMPLAAIATTHTEHVFPLEQIARFLIRVCHSDRPYKETLDDRR